MDFSSSTCRPPAPAWIATYRSSRSAPGSIFRSSTATTAAPSSRSKKEPRESACSPRYLPRGGSKAMNAINVIAPYKHLGMWVFDDPRVGLAQEPFVAGADTMIDRVVAQMGLPQPEQGFVLVFSGSPFPGHQF